MLWLSATERLQLCVWESHSRLQSDPLMKNTSLYFHNVWQLQSEDNLIDNNKLFVYFHSQNGLYCLQIQFMMCLKRAMDKVSKAFLLVQTLHVVLQNYIRHWAFNLFLIFTSLEEQILNQQNIPRFFWNCPVKLVHEALS